MPKKQRAEDQISQVQRAKLVELWAKGYELVDLCERYGISIDSAGLIIAEANAQRRGAAKVRDTLTDSYRAWLRQEVERQIG
ncbi:hypothetical protein [Rhizobium leguminosarum]|uniref:hypothetical protein n=1 Tax=Rhizobium leguminosarum TaxID=384 RepID=UPI0003FA6415|nr:hypothetical protein [Rhizobium leguminosarum]MBY5777774.1 hypothetical protein [Rhizobium leguminosarum]